MIGSFTTYVTRYLFNTVNVCEIPRTIDTLSQLLQHNDYLAHPSARSDQVEASNYALVSIRTYALFGWRKG